MSIQRSETDTNANAEGWRVINLETEADVRNISQRDAEMWERLFEQDPERRAEVIPPEGEGESRVID